jgi:hypothetical protein
MKSCIICGISCNNAEVTRPSIGMFKCMGLGEHLFRKFNVKTVGEPTESTDLYLCNVHQEIIEKFVESEVKQDMRKGFITKLFQENLKNTNEVPPGTRRLKRLIRSYALNIKRKMGFVLISFTYKL